MDTERNTKRNTTMDTNRNTEKDTKKYKRVTTEAQRWTHRGTQIVIYVCQNKNHNFLAREATGADK